jgi:phosphoglycolate phosphatase
MKPYKLLIFDFDGTLAATESAIQFCVKKSFTEYGLTPPSEASVKRAIGIPLAKMLAHLGNLDKETSEKVADIYRQYYAVDGMRLTSLFPSSYSTIETLHSRGYNLCVVSNKKYEVVRDSVEKTGLTSFFQLITGEGEGRYAKPDKQLFTNILEPFFNVKGSECLMIGDAVQDTDFALNCGMDAAWASYGFGSKNDCMNPNVKYVIDNISDLADILV